MFYGFASGKDCLISPAFQAKGNSVNCRHGQSTVVSVLQSTPGFSSSWYQVQRTQLYTQQYLRQLLVDVVTLENCPGLPDFLPQIWTQLAQCMQGQLCQASSFSVPATMAMIHKSRVWSFCFRITPSGNNQDYLMVSNEGDGCIS